MHYVSVMFSRLVSDLIVLCANVPDVFSVASVFSKSAVASVEVGEDAVLQYPSPCSIDDYISRYIPGLSARRSAMMLIGRALTVRVGNEERGMA